MSSVAIIGTRGYPSYYGGFETAVRNLAPYLAGHGWEVSVYSRPGAVRLDDPDRDLRVRTVMTRGLERKSVSTLSYGWSAAHHAARQKPDVALVMNVANGYWLPILRRAGIPTLVNVDGIEWDRAKWGRFAKSVFRSGARMTARFATKTVCDSKEIARRWNAEFGTVGHFIPYGGDVIDEVLPIEPGLAHREYVLAVARFVPENTIPEFFTAVPTIAERADVVIVGSSGYGGALDEHARQLSERFERVHWLGHISDDRRLFGLWQHAGVYFHGHSVGGTNPALVQAMACGAPVVARDTPFNREVLGPSGLFVGPTASRISEQVLALLGSVQTQREQAEVNLMRARTHYNWEDVNAQYESCLRELSATGRVGA